MKKVILMFVSIALSGVLTHSFGINGSYDYSDSVAQSVNPPNGLAVSDVPQFFVFGIDDNKYEDGVQWAVDMFRNVKNPAGIGNPATFDGTYAKGSFYMISSPAVGSKRLRDAWMDLYHTGNAINNHTKNHPMGWSIEDGINFTKAQWEDEIGGCNTFLTDTLGIPDSAIWGFRNPFLTYNNNTFLTEKKLGFTYDCAIEEGIQDSCDGTNFMWPYTLNDGSEAADLAAADSQHAPLDSTFSGLWEIPSYLVIAPPDSLCSKYGIAAGFRDSIAAYFKAHEGEDWDASIGKITGLDYNMWFSFNMTKEQYLAVLYYTLDLRLNGNRAPFAFGAHTDFYSEIYVSEPESCKTTYLTRREAMEEFLDSIVKIPAVRVVTARNLITWMRNPVKLGETPSTDAIYGVNVTAVNGTATITPEKEKYALGDTVTVSIAPDAGYKFRYWGGAINDTATTTKFVVNSSMTIFGVCKKPKVPFSTDKPTGNMLFTAVSWSADVDELGSKADYGTKLIQDSILKVTFTQVAKTDTSWPWVELTTELEDSASGLTGLSLTYKCDEHVMISLVQSDFTDKGDESYAHYQAVLPPTSDWKYREISLDMFFQPAWTPETSLKPLNLDHVSAISFVPAIGENGGSATIELKDLVLYGMNSTPIKVADLGYAKHFSISILSNSTLQFAIPSKGDYFVNIYGVNGRIVAKINPETYDVGIYKVNMDKYHLGSGVYVFKLQGNGRSAFVKGSIIGK